MRRAASLALCAAISGVALSMCGAQAPPPALSPAAEPPPAPNADEQEPTSGAAAAPATVQSPTSASAPPDRSTPEEREEVAPSGVERAAARAAFDRARADLEASATDCSLACRALGSMDRAVARLCSLADLPDDRRRCDDAKKRLLDARDRVRLACGTCAGGPSVKRSAPIPSE